MNIVKYTSEHASEWDHFVEQATNGTFLHTRKFLSYHGERFVDMSVLVRDAGGRTIAVFPAALDPGDGDVVVSHPGATYGGLVRGERMRGSEVLDALTHIRAYYAGLNKRLLRYKVVPHIYHTQPSEDDLYALFRMDATRYRCDLSAAIRVNRRGRISERRRRGQKKAQRGGVTISEGWQNLAEFWDVLEANLGNRHDAKPVHSVEEIRLLASLFPEQIELVTARMDNRVVAGVVVFYSDVVSHAQYISSNEEGFALSALDVVFEFCIERARQMQKLFFDFGVSNEEGGRLLNDGLFNFKSEFGAGGVVHEFYELEIK